MSLFAWWKRVVDRQRSFRRHEDSYATDRDALWQALRGTIKRQQALGKTVWLVTHRQATFSTLQERLADWSQPYEIVMEALDASDTPAEFLLSPRTVKLILAPLLQNAVDAAIGDGTYSSDQPIAVMVLERSNRLEAEHAIESFCRAVSLKIELGYLLSLDDPVVNEVVDPTSRLVLEQLGMDRHELITSNMITARINRQLRKSTRES